MSERMIERSVITEEGAGPRSTPARVVVRRIDVRSVARMGFRIGWVISLLPSLLASGIAAWALHDAWRTLDHWEPWSPWPTGTKVGPFPLPTPQFKPRGVLHVEGLYRLLSPVGHYPFLMALLGVAVLTILGGYLVALIMILAGAAYNLLARSGGGIALELAPTAIDAEREQRAVDSQQ